ncbi:Zinc finger protein like [Quillaja saponaria]|uniref:Zinc finger protein like n=1 Tax=Quillaja saponaria TaxID=32244 RepID=A0AAD7L6K2_QUISA|nr:Zinc finger protein like [Quillaja saponaria]
MWPPVCGSLHTGDGRNAVQPFRRHARGSRGHLLRRSDCSGISFHGQGHGRNQGRVGTIKGSSNPKSSVTEDVKLESTFEKAKPSDAPERPSEAAVAPKKSLCEPAAEGDEALNNQSQRFAWCKICNIYCTSREILQQHKVGKRHRRNMQNVVTVNKTTKSGDELQNKQIPAPQSKVEVSQQLQNKQDSEETVPKENLTTEVFGDENKVENAQRYNGEGGQPNVPKELLADLQATKSRMDQFDNGKRGMKRKMKGGRGGKQIRLVEAANEATALPKPLAVIPLLCVLCNVKCDKQEAFDSHLSGKKHLAKLRQFGGQHGTYKPVGLQVLYPPNPDIETLSLTQAHH